jgi:hypothetical protein
MNIFELSCMASPVGGLVGGLTAAKQTPAANSVVAGGIGLGVGIALCVASLCSVPLALAIAGLMKPLERKNLSWVSSTVQLILILPTLILPILSGMTAYWLVGCIYP